MKTLKEALEARAECAQKLKAIQTRAEGDTWNEEKDGPELDAAISALEEADKLVERMRKLEDVNKRAAGWNSDTTAGAPVSVNVIQSENRGDDPEKAKREFRLLKAMRETVEGRGLTGIEKEMADEGVKEARERNLSTSGNIQLPSWLVTRTSSSHEKRDMLSETTTAGGFTVQTEVGQLIPILEPRLRVREMGATVLTGLTGNIDFPRNDADASAAWEGEVDTTAETSPTFDRVQMSPERLAAFTDVSRQVMIQSTIDMENFVRQRLNFAVQKALDSAALNGSGSNDQPTGILNTGSVNDITIGTDGGPLTWALVVQFETEIATDNADMGRLGYLFTPGVAGALKTLKRDVAGNGFIWEGPNGAGNVNGYRALTTTQLPSNLTKGSGTNLHAAIFGNWADLIIGQWGGVDLLINPYTKGKEAIVEVIINSFWDVAVRHPQSFTICNEISLT